jgi:hypothetical protein
MTSGHGNRAAGLLMLLGIFVMGGIVAAHLGLLNRGAWEPDEYGFIAAFRDSGMDFFWDRLRTASPRPASELLIILYAKAVIATNAPLIVPALLVLWTGFFAAALPTLAGGRAPSSRILGTLAVLAFMLLGHGAFEVFYWPIGAVAYLPVLSAALFLLFCFANERWKAKPLGPLITVVLVGAAWSAEAGAMMALFFLGALMVATLACRVATPISRATIARACVAALAAVLVIVLVMTDGRLLMATGVQGSDPLLVHHWIGSAIQATSQGAAEFLSADAETFDRRHILTGLAIKLLFFFGVHLCWMTTDPDARRSRRWLPPLALALLATAFATLVVSYWNHGTTCCQRHNLLRQDFGFIALAAFAIWLPPVVPIERLHLWRHGLAPVLLIAAAALAIAPRARDIALDYRFYSEPSRARALTWASGFAPGSDMILYQPVPDNLFSQAMPPGTWHIGENWWVHGVLRFFGKQSARVSLAGTHIKDGAQFPD